MSTKNEVKRMFKKTPEEMQAFLQFKRRGSKVTPKKGKGSYSRKQKHRNAAIA